MADRSLASTRRGAGLKVIDETLGGRREARAPTDGDAQLPLCPRFGERDFGDSKALYKDFRQIARSNGDSKPGRDHQTQRVISGNLDAQPKILLEPIRNLGQLSVDSAPGTKAKEIPSKRFLEPNHLAVCKRMVATHYYAQFVFLVRQRFHVLAVNIDGENPYISCVLGH